MSSVCQSKNYLHSFQKAEKTIARVKGCISPADLRASCKIKDTTALLRIFQWGPLVFQPVTQPLALQKLCLFFMGKLHGG